MYVCSTIHLAKECIQSWWHTENGKSSERELKHGTWENVRHESLKC